MGVAVAVAAAAVPEVVEVTDAFCTTEVEAPEVVAPEDDLAVELVVDALFVGTGWGNIVVSMGMFAVSVA